MHSVVKGEFAGGMHHAAAEGQEKSTSQRAGLSDLVNEIAPQRDEIKADALMKSSFVFYVKFVLRSSEDFCFAESEVKCAAHARRHFTDRRSTSRAQRTSRAVRHTSLKKARRSVLFSCGYYTK
ncbi:MAG: hypothetical protein IJK64_07790 [Clostridia bacterium]|nr:hypothetical protein [Clostridia bacterium]